MYEKNLFNECMKNFTIKIYIYKVLIMRKGMQKKIECTKNNRETVRKYVYFFAIQITKRISKIKHNIIFLIFNLQ